MNRNRTFLRGGGVVRRYGMILISRTCTKVASALHESVRSTNCMASLIGRISPVAWIKTDRTSVIA
jgi:hypothetical protein